MVRTIAVACTCCSQTEFVITNTFRSVRRQHRRIANSILAPKVVEGYSAALDYEAHMLIRSLYQDTKQGEVPVNPARYVGRYVLK
jgi:hypothetical protein